MQAGFDLFELTIFSSFLTETSGQMNKSLLDLRYKRNSVTLNIHLLD